MSKGQKFQSWGLSIVAVLGVSTSALLLIDANRGQDHFESFNRALTQCHVLRRELTASLEQTRSELQTTERKLLALENHAGVPSKMLGTLPEQVQKNLISNGSALYITLTRAKLRSAPSTQSDEIAILSPESRIEVFGIAPDGQWLQVSSTGYVYHELLRPVAEKIELLKGYSAD
jgi:hypothetical protein